MNSLETFEKLKLRFLQIMRDCRMKMIDPRDAPTVILSEYEYQCLKEHTFADFRQHDLSRIERIFNIPFKVGRQSLLEESVRPTPDESV